ncbi:MAG: hypothetical protein M0R74_10495 [Dehalococcoidia bacterium]|jgi:hypothetical protein|nr:hypothetical protein [Dehalococcoidia bacterium]
MKRLILRKDGVPIWWAQALRGSTRYFRGKRLYVKGPKAGWELSIIRSISPRYAAFMRMIKPQEENTELSPEERMAIRLGVMPEDLSP